MLLLMPLTANAANLKNLATEISLGDDKTAEWFAVFEYDANVTRSDYYIISKIIGVEVMADDKFVECSVKSLELGTSIICENINAKKIVYRFRSLDKVSDLQGLNMFRHRFSVTQPAERFSMTLKLPLGTAIVEKSKLDGTGLKPFEPSWGQEGSDGRRIFVNWEAEKPSLGMTIDVSVIYERVVETSQILSLAIILSIAAALLFVIIIFRRKHVEDLMPILTESERKVMEILFKEKTGIDQRKIVKEMDFSKSKVSRIIQNLSSRGLIERERKGRANIIKLKKRT